MKNLKTSSTQASDTDDFGAKLGQQLVSTGKISEQDVARIVIAQRAEGLLFGEAAVGLGLLTPSELQRALSEQYAYPYVEVSGSGLSRSLVAAHRPFGAEAEVFRALRSQLLVRWFNDKRKTLAVSAPRGGCGASTVAANLAVSFAQLGERTLLIDANFRSPKQHELFGSKNSLGLSNVLTGRKAPKDSLVAVSPFASLSVLTAGPTPPNPQELLSRVGFSYLIETAPATFDVVIIDTPPVLEYADAQIVCATASGCLLVVRRNQTRMADIELAKGEIVPTGAQVVGTVVNG